MFRFVVEYWDEIEEKLSISKGFVAGASYAEAVKELEKYFGETINSIEKMYALENALVEDGEITMFWNE